MTWKKVRGEHIRANKVLWNACLVQKQCVCLLLLPQFKIVSWFSFNFGQCQKLAHKVGSGDDKEKSEREEHIRANKVLWNACLVQKQCVCLLLLPQFQIVSCFSFYFVSSHPMPEARTQGRVRVRG
jgi:hypothetical protein